MKNLRKLSIFACLFLLVFMPMRAEAMPPPSPAGGNYLALDGVDDHALLDFETFGFLLPKGTNEFTFEAWVYPTTPPDKDIHAMILSQQVMMDIVSHGHEGLGGLKVFLNLSKEDFMLQGSAHLARDVGHTIMSLTPIKFPANQWNHIAFQSNGTQTMVLVNDFAWISLGGTTLAHDADKISLGGHPLDFTLGGCDAKIPFHDLHSWGYFAGYIDEVRISKVARYNITKGRFTPPKKREKFKNDAKTVALWHFDEPRGTREFSDTSGNAYHLVGKNGAMTDGTLAVEAEGKLAITWGQLKQ